jgi:hypothetical protein
LSGYKYYGALHLSRKSYWAFATNIALLCTFLETGVIVGLQILRCSAPFLETGVVVGLVQRTIIFVEIGCRFLSEVQRTETNNPIEFRVLIGFVKVRFVAVL